LSNPKAPVTDNRSANVNGRAVEQLFVEIGASWYWLLAGPVSAIAMLLIEIHGGLGAQLLLPLCFLLLVSGFIALQVKAARMHTSVELTSETLRHGTETLPVDSIVMIYPEPGNEPAKWQSARALGELTGVPRGRTGIGLKLTGGGTAQAWARRHRELRAALTELVENRRPGDRPFGTAP
jgi:hypothetical protein